MYNNRNSISAVTISANIALLFVIFLFQSSSSVAHAKTFDEAKVKAVFLYNLTKFVTWPENITSERKRFTVGVLGDSPFDSHLQKVIQGESVKGRKIDIQWYSQKDEVDWARVDLLFISGHYKKEIQELLMESHRRQVLTVGDMPEFCQFGGNINLLSQGKRVKIEINIKEAKKSGFFISAQVLKLAKIVETQERLL